MQVKSLLLAAFISLGVITGCDDPEVQDKLGQILQYGAVVARVECVFDDSSLVVSAPAGNPATKSNVHYSATLIADNSCLVSLTHSTGTQTIWNSRVENKGCEIKLHDDPFGPSTYGNDWEEDVSKYNYAGSMSVKYCKPSMLNIPNNPPYYTAVCPWIGTCDDPGCTEVNTNALTTPMCRGFNLTAFE